VKVITIPIEEIVIGERLRPINYDEIGELVNSIAENGLINPIAVGDKAEDGYPLIAGLHRLTACKRLGLVEIAAHVIEGSAIELQIAEIDENLIRLRLTPVQRAKFTQRRRELYEMLHPETKRGGDRGNQHTGGKARQTDNVSFSRDAALKTGVDERTIRRETRRGANILPEVQDIVQGTYFDQGRHLDALARLPPDEQREIARLVEQGDNDEAMGALIPELQVMRDTRAGYRDLVMAWNKANEEAREQFVEKKARELEKAVRPKPKAPLSIVRNTDA
jgi:ParB family chromosome partitioning protein